MHAGGKGNGCIKFRLIKYPGKMNSPGGYAYRS